MLLETLEAASVQAIPAIILIWATTRLFPALSPKVQVWLWRLVFLRLTIGLFLWPAVSVPVLPPVTPVYGDEAYMVDIPLAQPFPWLEVAWILGVLSLVLLACRESVRVRAFVRASSGKEPASIATAAKPDNSQEVWRTSDLAQVPMVVGLIRPIILVPRNVVETSSPEDLTLIVAHEAGHIAHRDLFWAWVVWAGRAAFFFHPLVWLAARSERFAREAAADRYALDSVGADPHRYGQILMRVALAEPHHSPFSPVGLAMTESYRFVYRRLETMKHHSRRPSLSRILTTSVLCALTIGLLPTFNFVPAQAQSPMADFIEPAVYPMPDTQSVSTPLATAPRRASTTAPRARAARRAAARTQSQRRYSVRLLPLRGRPAQTLAPAAPSPASTAPAAPNAAPAIAGVPAGAAPPALPPQATPSITLAAPAAMPAGATPMPIQTLEVAPRPATAPPAAPVRGRLLRVATPRAIAPPARARRGMVKSTRFSVPLNAPMPPAISETLPANAPAPPDSVPAGQTVAPAPAVAPQGVTVRSVPFTTRLLPLRLNVQPRVQVAPRPISVRTRLVSVRPAVRLATPVKVQERLLPLQSLSQSLPQSALTTYSVPLTRVTTVRGAPVQLRPRLSRRVITTPTRVRVTLSRPKTIPPANPPK